LKFEKYSRQQPETQDQSSILSEHNFSSFCEHELHRFPVRQTSA